MAKTKQPIRVIPKQAPKSAVAANAPKSAPKPTPKPTKEVEHKVARGVKIVKTVPADDAPPELNGVPAVEPTAGEAILDIPIAEIQLTPDPYRSESEDEERDTIFDMARSLQDLGMMQPVVVRVNEEGAYELIAGRKRIKAASVLEWETVPALVKNYDDVKAELGRITENVVRSGYKRAEYDKAIARWAVLYESLHPGAKKGTAGGRASATKKALASGKKVTAKPPAKSFSRTVAEKTGVKPRAVEKARKRGTTFTDDDYAVFKSKGIKVHDQDEVAAITDPKKRAEVIKSIAAGVPFRKAYDFVMLPAGASSESIEVSEETGRPMTDEEWLAQCPVRGEVVTKAFDAQALFYRRMLDFKGRLERGFNAARKEFKGLTGGPHGYPAAVHRFLKVKHPKEWTVCGVCGGKGETGKGKEAKPCGDCDQTGFKVG